MSEPNFSFTTSINDAIFGCDPEATAVVNIDDETASVTLKVVITADSESNPVDYEAILMDSNDVVIEADPDTTEGYEYNFIISITGETQSYTLDVRDNLNDTSITCTFTLQQVAEPNFTIQPTIDSAAITCGGTVMIEQGTEQVEFRVTIVTDLEPGALTTTLYGPDDIPITLSGLGTNIRGATLDTSNLPANYRLVVEGPDSETQECLFTLDELVPPGEIAVLLSVDGNEFLCGDFINAGYGEDSVTFSMTITETLGIPAEDFTVLLMEIIVTESVVVDEIPMNNIGGYSYEAVIGTTNLYQFHLLRIFVEGVSMLECIFRFISTYDSAGFLNGEEFNCGDVIVVDHDAETAVLRIEVIPDYQIVKLADITDPDNPIEIPAREEDEEDEIFYTYFDIETTEDEHLFVYIVEVEPTDQVDPEESVESTLCRFSIVRGLPPPNPMTVANFIIDDLPVACNSTHYTFCDLSATKCYSPCSVTVIGRVQSSEFEELDYLVYVDSVLVTSGELTLTNLEGFTDPITLELESEFTEILIEYYYGDDPDTVHKCSTIIQRRNSRLLTTPQCCGNY